MFIVAAAAAAAADTADTADTLYTARNAELTVDSWWVDACSFGVGLDGWLCWSPQKLI